MTNIEMIQGMFNFPISKEVVQSVLYKRNVQADSDVYLDLDELELCVADILMVLSRASQGYSTRTGSDAFSMTLRGEIIPLADRVAMRNEANAIYKRHKEEHHIRLSNAINIY